MTSVLSLSWMDSLFALWHANRMTFFVSCGIVLLCLQVRSFRQKRDLERYFEEQKQNSTLARVSVIERNQNASKELRPPISLGNAPPNPKAGPKRIVGTKKTSSPKQTHENTPVDSIQPIVLYFSVGGTTKSYAETLTQKINEENDSGSILPVIVHDLTDIDYDDYFIATPSLPAKNASLFYILLIPSYDIDTELLNLLAHMQETHHDFRIDTGNLSSLAGYAVLGFGDKSGWPTEADGFCSQAIEIDKWMARLTGGKRAYPLGMADILTDGRARFDEWVHGVQSIMRDITESGGLGDGVPGSGDALESGDEGDILSEEDESRPSRVIKASKRPKPLSSPDLEDVRAPIPVDFTTPSAPSGPKPMVPRSSPTYAALTKQGYTIVGAHSGVKICRWTKSALRGRGSCYKFSFYGIASHLCMEATPSLSCSNKCVFCWRHGTNPVGTTWRWTVDPPDMIFAGMKKGHYDKIKMMRGVPGLRAERFAEAKRIRHCALSLVGEPIFYPHINELLTMLHKEHISSFLVCNAQHPDQLAALGPVTQLYVSIDASNKDSLKRIDRPLHRDFWERFLRCMDILRDKRFTHRTVFRLTLVKGFNLEDEAEGYADLVERALPSFVEIKGVTYCGTSTAAGAGLSMQNVPFYEEVAEFVRTFQATLVRRGLAYGIAAEHAHSCCVLLADEKRFFRPSRSDGIPRWHTLIDYTKFFECVESNDKFSPEDYIGEPTPEWALWGNGGFDPRDQRVDRKGRPKDAIESA